MYLHRFKIKRRWEQVSEEDEGGGTNNSNHRPATLPRIHPRASSISNPGISPNPQAIKQAALAAAVSAQAASIQQQQELCNLGSKLVQILPETGGALSTVNPTINNPLFNHTTAVHHTPQTATAENMSSYGAANNLAALLPPNHHHSHHHHPHQQSFIPGASVSQAGGAGYPQPAAIAALTQQATGNPASSFVNFNTLLNQKDSRWLQLEVCREFQRNKCSRPDVECKFAHPGPAIEIQSGKVTACYDSIKVF